MCFHSCKGRWANFYLLSPIPFLLLMKVPQEMLGEFGSFLEEEKGGGKQQHFDQSQDLGLDLIILLMGSAKGHWISHSCSIAKGSCQLCFY